MTTRIRPFLTTGAALASAAAIVLAAPTIAPSNDIAIAGVPTPAKLSNAQYELTALADITAQGISDAYWFGWGGYIGSETGSGVPDPYYPEFEGDLFSSGVSGVLYYLTDNILDQFGAIDIDNYYFEIGTLAGIPNAGYSPWGAVIYVGTSQLFGQTSPIAIAAQAIFRNGLTNTVNGLIVALTDPIPVVGTATSIFYTGFSNDLTDPTFYGTGVPGLLAYASTVITGLLPGGALPFAATAAATKTVAAKTLAATETIETVTEKSDGVAGSKTEAAEEKTSTDGTGSESEGKSESTETTTETKTEAEPETKTETTTETKTEAEPETKTETDTGKPADTATEKTSTDAKADGPAAEAPAVKATTGRSAAPKAGKKADNPLAKIGKRISDAVSGKKAKGGESGAAGSDAGGSGAGSGGSASSAG